MPLTIKIIGSLGFSLYKSKLVKKYTSCRLFWDDHSIQIDIGNRYEGKPVDKLLITHTHYDHVQEFKTCPKTTEVLVPSGTFIDKLRNKNPYITFRLFKTKTSLDGLTVKPFPVLHSSTSLTYGFKFFWKNKTIVWLPDYFIIPTFSEVLSGIDLLFLGCGAFRKDLVHQGYGHGQKAVLTTLEKISNMKNPPKKIYTIHYGIGSPPIVLKTRFLQKQFPSLDIDFTRDGKTLEIQS